MDFFRDGNLKQTLVLIDFNVTLCTTFYHDLVTLINRVVHLTVDHTYIYTCDCVCQYDYFKVKIISFLICLQISSQLSMTRYSL